MRRGLLDIGEGKLAIGVGHAIDLIETRKRVLHMACVGERLFPLARKGIGALREVASRGQVTVLGMGLPSGLRGHFVLLLSFSLSRGSVGSPRFRASAP